MKMKVTVEGKIMVDSSREGAKSFPNKSPWPVGGVSRNTGRGVKL